MDIFDSGYAGRIMLYIFCGLLDAMWQTAVYWLMGAMSNDPAKLAYFTGFCMSPLSCPAIIRLDYLYQQTSPFNQPVRLVLGAQMET
jgi:hypothetical protein